MKKRKRKKKEKEEKEEERRRRRGEGEGEERHDLHTKLLSKKISAEEKLLSSNNQKKVK